MQRRKSEPPKIVTFAYGKDANDAAILAAFGDMTMTPTVSVSAPTRPDTPVQKRLRRH